MTINKQWLILTLSFIITKTSKASILSLAPVQKLTNWEYEILKEELNCNL